MSKIGTVSTVSRDQEYAIIEPDDGSPCVYVHAENFGCYWKELNPGTPVRFSSIQGAQRLRAYNVMVLPGRRDNPLATRLAPTESPPTSPTINDRRRRELDVVSYRGYQDLIATVLQSAVPLITSEQVTRVSTELTARAIQSGWLDSPDDHSRCDHGRSRQLDAGLPSFEEAVLLEVSASLENEATQTDWAG